MKLLVTGATGLVGNNVVRLALARGMTVRVLARENCDPRPLQDLPVEIVPGDLRDAGAVERALDGVSHVVHSAAMVRIGWRDLELQREVNVAGTRRVCEAARRAQAKLVHVSSVDALGIGSRELPANEETPRVGKTPCPYVITKREAEEAVREAVGAGLDATIVNPGFMIGRWDWKPSSGQMLVSVATTFAPLAPTGGCSICDVEDVAMGILAALDRGQAGRNYILGGYNLSYLEIWRLFARVGGRRGPRFRMGPAQRWLVGRGGDLLGRFLGKELPVNSAAIAMSSLYHYYDSQRARQELGYANRPLEATIRDAWLWFQEHGFLAT